MSGWWLTPDAAVCGLTAGMLLIYLECNRVGWVVPGCAGGTLVLLALHRLAGLPLAASGGALVGAGVGLILGSGWIGWRGLGAGGGILLVTAGLRRLVQPSSPERVHLSVAFAASLVLGVTTVWLAGIARRARLNKRILHGAGNVAALNRVD